MDDINDFTALYREHCEVSGRGDLHGSIFFLHTTDMLQHVLVYPYFLLDTAETGVCLRLLCLPSSYPMHDQT